MKYWRYTYVLLIFFILTNTVSHAKPTSNYPSVTALLEKKRKDLKARLVRNPLKPSCWKNHNDAKKMLYLFRSARVVESVHISRKKVRNKDYHTAFNTLHAFLFQIQRNIRVSTIARCGQDSFNPNQTKLDDRILKLNTIEFAQLLSEANRTVPPTCGDAEKGIAHIDFYNLEYKIRNLSHYNKQLSHLEDEILKEYSDLQKEPAADIFGGLLLEIVPQKKHEKHHGSKRKTYKYFKTTPSKHGHHLRARSTARTFASTTTIRSPLENESSLPRPPKPSGISRKSTLRLPNVQELTEDTEDGSETDSDITRALDKIDSQSDYEEEGSEDGIAEEEDEDCAPRNSYSNIPQPPKSENTGLPPFRILPFTPSVIYKSAPESGYIQRMIRTSE